MRTFLVAMRVTSRETSRTYRKRRLRRELISQVSLNIESRNNPDVE